MKTEYSIKFTKWCIGIFTLCILLPFGLHAQAPTLTVTAPNVVAVGQKVQIVFETDISDFSSANFIPPADFDKYNIIAGPYVNTVRSSSFVNGKSSYSTKSQVIFVILAEKEGKITIGRAGIETADGKTYYSSAKEIEVVKEDVGEKQNSGGDAQAVTSNENIFIRTDVSKSTLFKGDYLIATIKLYVKDVNLQGFEGFKPPTFNGFYSQELEAPSQLVFQRENVNGRIYNVAVLRKYILYPQQVGSLKIEPSELSAVVLLPSSRPRSFMDDFFAQQGEVVRKKLVSPQVAITVKDLPAGAPASFSGAVGNFSLETSLSKADVVANKAISHVAKITGTGNFKLFTTPKPAFPTDFEVYEPKTTDNLKNSASGLTGSRSTETTIVPRSAGIFTIPSTEFTYFDPSAGKYVTLASKEHTVTVAKDSTANHSVAVSTNRQQNIRYIGDDIRSNTILPQAWRVVGSTFFCSMTYYSLYILLVVAFIVAVFVLRERARRRQNVVQSRIRKANAVAKKRLSAAGNLLKSGNIASFYEELLKASWGYLSDKFNIPLANLSRDNIREVLNSKGVDADDIDAFINVVDECEFARYAPGTGHTQMEHVYNDAISTISKLEQKIR